MEYKKPPMKISEQIKLLKERGLIINDEEKLERYLRNISYYHFSTYFKHFQKDDLFIKDTNFEDVLSIYVFDQKLRLLLLDVLERIEKSFKCHLVYEMSVKTGDPFWIANHNYFQDGERYGERIAKMLEDLKFSKENCIRYYYEKYNEPKYPPAWMIIEVLSFGQTVMIYNQLELENQEVVANSYGINKRFISNWFYALSILRNLCAHHSRLWNNEFLIRLNQGHGFYGKLFDNSNGNRLFNYLVILHAINSKFNPTSGWVEKLDNIIIEHAINISHMGFPDNWKERLQKIKEKEIFHG